MWIKHPYSELARTLFRVESTNNLKIKITQHRVLGDGFIWEGISFMNAWWVSQSASVGVSDCCSVVAVSDGVFEENN